MVSLPPASIFKAYDIRGVVGKTLDSQIATQIGRAFGDMLLERGENECVIGRDGRLSGTALSAALKQGLLEAGVNVTDLGLVTTPMTYFANYIALEEALSAQGLAQPSQNKRAYSSIMVTGSHNPPDYNGFKMVMSNQALYGEQIQNIYRRICAHEAPGLQKNAPMRASGLSRTLDIFPHYQQRIVNDIQLARPLKLAIDCGNGVAGAFAPSLFRALGCQVTELFCEIDGHFPNHHPDPAQLENLQDLMVCLRETDCDLGLAFDGDGDRLGVVTKNGQVIFPDRQLMLFAQDVLQRHPGASIIYDVKCTRQLAPWIEQHGGQGYMWKTGHSLIKAKLHEMDAPLAGEMSGHLFFKDRWYGFDDGLYAGARLIEILSRSTDPSHVLNSLPSTICTPEIHLPCAEGEAFSVLEKIKSQNHFLNAQKILTIDGIRVEYPYGFGLVRPSNTTPVMVMRFEADTDHNLHKIKQDFKKAILAVKSDAALPF